MLLYIYHIFRSMRPMFSRETPWILFCSVVLGLIGCTEMVGISSLCRFWGLNQWGYLSLLHFFQADSWNHITLMRHWSQFVLRQELLVEENGRALMVGDHTLQAKDGRHMPGVVSLHQDSETQSKPSYFRGHCWGALALVVGSFRQCFALPVMAQIHQGFAHRAESVPKDTLVSRPIQMALDFALFHQRHLILILDAFFSVSPVFELARVKDQYHEPWVEIITKAKRGYVAFERRPAQEPKRGRPKIFNEPIKLDEIFDKEPFQRGFCQIYGTLEEVSYRVMNLYWGPKKLLIRFVWVQNSLGRMILMCSDLEQDPIRAIELYCLRMRIEMMFDRLKNLLKAFEYHFWTKALPRHSRRPKKNTELQAPETPEQRQSVKRTWRAYERFVSLGCIALGILQLIALKYPEQIWEQFQSFLRTRSGGIPSERVVKDVLASRLRKSLGKVAACATLHKIHDYHSQAGFLWESTFWETHDLCDTA